VIATLHALRAFGVRISMEISARAILRAIVSLGIKITAEGVETESDLAYPKAEGCTEGQGFLFSKALPQGEILVLLKKTNGRDIQAA
jgi:EAL domain-containing protein (putative c-di-GMP-specific phosphodiesterase class I)